MDLIKQLMKHFKALTKALLNQPEVCIGAVEFLTPEEIVEHRISDNTSKNDHPEEKSVLSLFFKQVQRTPNNLALVFENEKGTEKTYTYKELDERSNQLGHYLKQTYQLTAEDLIGIKLEKSDQMIIAILAVLKSGAAYVPIDPEYPEQRITYIEQDANVSIYIDAKELQKFEENAALFSKQNDNVMPPENSLAYVIYTSGSTGEPKGVMVEHKNLYYSTHSRINVYPHPQHFLLLSSIAFDSSLAGIFGTLCTGGQLRVAATINAENIDQITETIGEKGITQLLVVPSLYKVLLMKLAGKKNTLKVVTLAGEKCPEKLVRLHHEMAELNDCELYNEYGPTECTVWATYLKYDRNKSFNSSIGKPLENTEILILNDHLKMQPAGVVGEICIGGNGVARGYLNNPELTDTKYIKNPYEPFDRIYRTGDIGERTASGEIIFLGRIDDQVKIRGYRIQLGEIEYVFAGFEGIDQTVVIAQENKRGELELIGYFTGDDQLNSGDLNEKFRAHLPSYMVPSGFIHLDEMPLTSNGKLDKVALVKEEGKKLASGETYVAPINTVQKRLVAIWEEILEREDIGIRDDFFSLGGHSLSAIRLISKIQEEFDTKFELVKLFEENTIEKISELLDFLPSQHNYDSDEEMEEFKI